MTSLTSESNFAIASPYFVVFIHSFLDFIYCFLDLNQAIAIRCYADNFRYSPGKVDTAKLFLDTVPEENSLRCTTHNIYQIDSNAVFLSGLNWSLI